MTAARRGGAQPPANAAVRGGALILAAIVVGALLLARGFGDEGGLVAAGPDTTTTTAADGTPGTSDPNGGEDSADDGDETQGEDDEAGSEGGDEGGAEPTVRPNEQVGFVAINGTTSNGAAGRLATQLSTLNYVQVSVGNVPGGGGAETSAIYYAEGWQLEAQAMATNLGVDPAVAVPMPPPFEVDAGDAAVVVVLGRDGVITA